MFNDGQPSKTTSQHQLATERNMCTDAWKTAS